jgi:hypothetical protein
LDFTEKGVVGHWRVKFISFFFILRQSILEKFTYLKDLLSEKQKRVELKVLGRKIEILKKFLLILSRSDKIYKIAPICLHPF